MITYKLILKKTAPFTLGFSLVTRIIYGAFFALSLFPLLLGWPFPWPLMGLPLILAAGTFYTEEWYLEGDKLTHRHGLLFWAFQESYRREEVQELGVSTLGRAPKDGQKIWPRFRTTHVLSFHNGKKQKMIDIRKGDSGAQTLESWKAQLDQWLKGPGASPINPA
jgi:hypothetical protein